MRRAGSDRDKRSNAQLLIRLSQNVLTCPNRRLLLHPLDELTYFKLGRKIAFFGDGLILARSRFGLQVVWVIPTLSGEFVLDRRFGFRDGLMGGNLWFMEKRNSTDRCAARVLSQRGPCGQRSARSHYAVSRRNRGERLEAGQQI